MNSNLIVRGNQISHIPNNLTPILKAVGAKGGDMPSVLVAGAQVENATYRSLRSPANIIAQAIIASYPEALAAAYSAEGTSAGSAFNVDFDAGAVTPAPTGIGATVYGARVSIAGSISVPASGGTVTFRGTNANATGYSTGVTTSASLVSLNNQVLDQSVAIRPPSPGYGPGLGSSTSGFNSQLLFLPGYDQGGGYVYSPALLRPPLVHGVANLVGFGTLSANIRVVFTGFATGTTVYVTLLTRGTAEIDNLVAGWVSRTRNASRAVSRLARPTGR